MEAEQIRPRSGENPFWKHTDLEKATFSFCVLTHKTVITTAPLYAVEWENVWEVDSRVYGCHSSHMNGRENESLWGQPWAKEVEAKASQAPKPQLLCQRGAVGSVGSGSPAHTPAPFLQLPDLGKFHNHPVPQFYHLWKRIMNKIIVSTLLDYGDLLS